MVLPVSQREKDTSGKSTSRKTLVRAALLLEGPEGSEDSRRLADVWRRGLCQFNASQSFFFFLNLFT